MMVSLLYALRLIDFWRRHSHISIEYMKIMHWHHSFLVQRCSCQRLPCHLLLDDLLQPTQNKWRQRVSAMLTAILRTFYRCRYHNNTQHTVILLLSVDRQQKQIRRVKLPSLLAVDIPSESPYSSALSKSTLLLALVAASVAYASCFWSMNEGISPICMDTQQLAHHSTKCIGSAKEATLLAPFWVFVWVEKAAECDINVYVIWEQESINDTITPCSKYDKRFEIQQPISAAAQK